MTANTLAQPRFAQPSALPAWCMIAGAVLTFILGVPLASFQAQEPAPWWIPALNSFSHLLLIVGVVGLARTGAAGRGGLATAGLGLTLLGLVVLIVGELTWLAGLEIAVLFYNALRHGMDYSDPGTSYYEERYRARVLVNLRRRAKNLGFVLQEASSPA